MKLGFIMSLYRIPISVICINWNWPEDRELHEILRKVAFGNKGNFFFANQCLNDSVMKKMSIVLFTGLVLCACNKGSSPASPDALNFKGASVNGVNNNTVNYYNASTVPIIRFQFSSALDKTSVGSSVSLQDNAGNNIPLVFSYENNDSTLVVQPGSALKRLTIYKIAISTALESERKSHLSGSTGLTLITAIDSTD